MTDNVQHLDIIDFCKPGDLLTDSIKVDGLAHIELDSEVAWELVRRILSNFEENDAWASLAVDVRVRHYPDIDRAAWEQGETE